MSKASRPKSLVYATNETNSANTDGVCTVLYFCDEADRDTIKEALRYILESQRFPNAALVADPDDEDESLFDYQELPTPVSKLAKLYRYECYGSC